MQTNRLEELEREKQEIRNKIKRFFEEEGITYKEEKNKIIVEGEFYSSDIMPYPEISLRIGKGKYLTVTDKEDKIVLNYFKASPKNYSKDLEIEKNDLIYIMPAIYMLENHLVFLF